MEKFNEWSNKDTWAVNLWLTSNNENVYLQYEDCYTIEALRKCFEDNYFNGHDGIDLSKVDFKELLNNKLGV